MTLSQKETTLLQDLKSQEQLCVDKYSKYSSDACDGQLKNLFSQIGQVEQQHLSTITQILGGTVPTMGGGDTSQPTATPQSTTPVPSKANSTTNSFAPMHSQPRNMFLRSMTPAFSNSKTLQFVATLNHIQKKNKSTEKKSIAICPKTACTAKSQAPFSKTQISISILLSIEDLVKKTRSSLLGRTLNQVRITRVLCQSAT